MENQEETKEPRSKGALAGAQAASDEAILLVLHHADAGQIGAVSALPAGQAVLIGRESPLFLRPAAIEPLRDPCISRRQCTVRFDEASQTFEVELAREARRPARLLAPDGSPIEGKRAPPGSLLALGDRALLGLELRPRRGPSAPGLLGESAAHGRLLARIAAVAAGEETALILGETGTGKELTARAIHQASPRAAGPFVAVNCAALPESLAESELFGHTRGAFSGATGGEGLFGAARGGTLFLDEVGELPLPVQTKLLRALELRQIRPVGATHEIPADVRVVAATNRDLELACQQGSFRLDLLARLDGVRVPVPPLRERALDAPLLFARLLAERLDAEAPRHPGCARLRGLLFHPASLDPPPLPQEFFVALMQHRWPRNFREIQSMISEVVVAAREGGALRLPSLPRLAPPSPPPARARPDRAALLQLLDEHDGVQSRVAERLGVSPTTMDRWMRELSITRPRDLAADTIAAALRDSGSLELAASSLGVSPRGLKLRMRQLELPLPEPADKSS